MTIHPGYSFVVPIRYGQNNPAILELWLNRGRDWLTAAVSEDDSAFPVGIQVYNLTQRKIAVPQRTCVARLVEHGYLPERAGFVRVGSPRYSEWQQLIYECSYSRQYRRRLDRAEYLFSRSLPPSVDRPSYPTPRRILERPSGVRPDSTSESGRLPRERQVPLPSSTESVCTLEEQRRREPEVYITPAHRELSGADSGEPNCDRGNGVVGHFDVRMRQHVESAAADCASDVLADGSQAGLCDPDPNAPIAFDLAAADTPASNFPAEDDPSLVESPIAKLAWTYRVTTVLDQGAPADMVFYHEGTDQIVNLDEADYGEPSENTPEELAQLKKVLYRHEVVFLGHGNALPSPARGTVCDIDVGDSKPVAQRARRIPGHLLPKVYELLKRLLEAGLIEYSTSEWASPIVVVLKKNGEDIRLCVDYRAVNLLTKLMNYPLPLIDELLDNFDSAMWFLSLDMASGFWAIPMTLRAKIISAFICPLGHFQWLRMPFGLKNAPLIYQKCLDNALWGFKRLSVVDELSVDPDVLDFLRLTPDPLASQTSVCDLHGVASANLGNCDASPRTNANDGQAELMSSTVYDSGRIAPSQMGPVLGRSSYIDDIACGVASWDELCSVLDSLLYRLRYWGISVSLPKSAFGKRQIAYLSHKVGRDGIEATPKIVKSLENLTFPKIFKGIQSFLGSLNYYHKFIEDFSVLASVLYELSDDQIRLERDLDRARRSFAILKDKIANTPLLRHPDRSKPFVIVIHANPWAISAVLGQEHGGVIHPVRYTGRTLHDAELRYHEAEKEVLALLRVLSVFYTLVAGQHIQVYTRFSTLKWLLRSKSLQGRALQWAVLLSPWSLEIRQVTKDEDGLAAILAASITSRDQLDQIAEQLIPLKGARVKAPPISLEMLEDDYEGHLLSFDGAAKLKSNQGSAGFVLWKLPEWEIAEARGVHLENVTVNKAEYHGLLSGLQLAIDRQIKEIVVVGDSRIAIQQAQGLINCNSANLQKLLCQYETLAASFTKIQLIHVKREFNSSADYLTSRVLRLGASINVEDPEELGLLRSLSKIHERVMKKDVPQPDHVAPNPDVEVTASNELDGVAKKIADAFLAVTRLHQRAASQDDLGGGHDADQPRPHRNQARSRGRPSSGEEFAGTTEEDIAIAIDERWNRIRENQNADGQILNLKRFLKGNLSELSQKEARELAKIADRYILDPSDIIRFVSAPAKGRPREIADTARLVIPNNLREDVLHQCHSDTQGGHQGIMRTYERARREFHWIGMYADVERYVRNCVDCVTGKGTPRNPGPSPGNVIAAYPFHIISMDFVIPLPRSARGNTALLLFQDTFSGFCMCQPMSSTTAQDVAEAYERVVFRHYGASSMVRHDRDPRFMSEVFKHFREMMGSQQRATLAYRPQTNGQQERSVQTVIRSVRAYVEDPAQDDWDDIAEKLMFTLNTSFDATRRETPFYLVHGWDAKTTMSAMLSKPSNQIDLRESYFWRIKTQRQYELAAGVARDLQIQAKGKRAEKQTQLWKDLSERLKSGFEIGDSVWLYMARVKPGLSRKLAHLWHGPFRILEKSDDFRYRLKISGADYRFYPWVHVSRLKSRAIEPDRPATQMNEVPPDLDLDAALLPEDSWSAVESAGEFEVTAIRDVRWVKKTRTSKRVKEYLVEWKGYAEPGWVPLRNLNCGRLIHDFDKGARARARFRAMQSAEEDPAQL